MSRAFGRQVARIKINFKQATPLGWIEDWSNILLNARQICGSEPVVHPDVFANLSPALGKVERRIAGNRIICDAIVARAKEIQDFDPVSPIVLDVVQDDLV